MEEKPCGSTKMLVPLAEGATSMLLSHSTLFRCSKNPLCGRRARHSTAITRSGVQQWCIHPVEAQRDSLSLLSPFLHLQAITTASVPSNAGLCCPCLPMKKPEIIIVASWNPMVMRWWQTQVVSPIVSLIQTFRLQFKGSCIPVSYSLKLAYLVSKLWSHPLWGMLCCPEGANMNELASSLWGIFPPCPTVALFDSQSALPTPHHARR